MVGLVGSGVGGQRIQISSEDFSAFDNSVGHAAPCNPDGEVGMMRHAGLLSAQGAINSVMLSLEVRDAIVETRPDDVNRLIRPERKLLSPAAQHSGRIRAIWRSIGNTNSSGRHA